MDISIGLTASKEIVVEEKDSAKALGSGGLDVFGTPAMIALMENVALEMIRPHLPQGHDSVGIKIDAEHLKASPIGASIKCTARVSAVDGRKISYTIECIDGHEDKIGSAQHDRFVVDMERFMSKVK